MIQHNEFFGMGGTGFAASAAMSRLIEHNPAATHDAPARDPLPTKLLKKYGSLDLFLVMYLTTTARLGQRRVSNCTH